MYTYVRMKRIDILTSYFYRFSIRKLRFHTFLITLKIGGELDRELLDKIAGKTITDIIDFSINSRNSNNLKKNQKFKTLQTVE